MVKSKFLSVFKYFVVITRRLIYIACYYFDQVRHVSADHVIYCFHDVGYSKTGYCSKPEIFFSQIELLLQSRKPLSLQDLVKDISHKKLSHEHTFTLSFDDGYAGVRDVLDFLHKHSINPTIFVLTGDKNSFPGFMKQQKYLSWNHIKELTKKGCEIGSHGVHHKNNSILTDKEVDHEMAQSKLEIENHKITCHGYAYPHGKYDKSMKKQLKKYGYTYACTMDDACISNNTDVYELPRIGIDETHSVSEILYASSPSSIAFRKYMKKSPLGRYL